MGYLSIRDLQKISERTMSALSGPTPVKSGERTVAILIPLRKPDPKKLAAWAKEVARLRATRDPAEDDKFFADNPDLDPTDYTPELIAKLQGRTLARKAQSGHAKSKRGARR
jgi:hypothetical protein